MRHKIGNSQTFFWLCDWSINGLSHTAWKCQSDYTDEKHASKLSYEIHYDNNDNTDNNNDNNNVDNNNHFNNDLNYKDLFKINNVFGKNFSLF